ncbi:hypothetical protein U91I_00534 [alpha proteobacterium U9-1i]|nr:hypothetical protein U91I_00534 [alpha proteobacterium U9-1i]
MAIATAEIVFAPTGLIWRINCPIERVSAQRSARTPFRSSGAVAVETTKSTNRRRVR